MLTTGATPVLLDRSLPRLDQDLSRCDDENSSTNKSSYRHLETELRTATKAFWYAVDDRVHEHVLRDFTSVFLDKVTQLAGSSDDGHAPGLEAAFRLAIGFMESANQKPKAIRTIGTTMLRQLGDLLLALGVRLWLNRPNGHHQHNGKFREARRVLRRYQVASMLRGATHLGRAGDSLEDVEAMLEVGCRRAALHATLSHKLPSELTETILAFSVELWQYHVSTTREPDLVNAYRPWPSNDRSCSGVCSGAILPSSHTSQTCPAKAMWIWSRSNEPGERAFHHAHVTGGRRGTPCKYSAEKCPGHLTQFVDWSVG